MQTMSAKSLVAAGLLAALSASTARADVVSDRAAAILIIPYVASTEVEPVPFAGASVGASIDTIIQISNTSTEPVTLQCFYVSANGHCAITNDACYPDGSDVVAPCVLDGDFCVPGWTETDFRVYLTPRQPIAWLASRGLAREEFPLDGVAFRGPHGESNAGSAVPPVVRERLALSSVPMAPQIESFAGELKCVVVDADGHGVDRNVIKGEATVVSEVRTNLAGDQISRFPRVAKYSAYGVQAIGGDVNGDGDLDLGGNEEYNNCPNFLIIDHFFDGAIPELADGSGQPQESALTLVPCSQNIRRQIPGSTTAQFLVFIEFEQRFSTSRKVDCWFNRRLSLIDTSDPSRSIFSAAVAGTVAGQTRVRGVTGGLLGVLHENLDIREPIGQIGIRDVISNLHLQGERDDIDHIVLP